MTSSAGALDAGTGHQSRTEGDLIRTEIPGTVLTVLASVGDRVVEGSIVALLESMKMEIPVLAETAGTITQVLVAAGAAVQVDDTIAISESASPCPAQ